MPPAAKPPAAGARAVAPAPPAPVPSVGRAHAAAAAAAGTATGSEVERQLEARIAALEERLAARPSQQKLEADEQKLAALEKHLEKKLAGAKKGMEALHGRLQAIELGVAKVPEAFKKISARNREMAREQAERTEQLDAMEQALSELVE